MSKNKYYLISSFIFCLAFALSKYDLETRLVYSLRLVHALAPRTGVKLKPYSIGTVSRFRLTEGDVRISAKSFLQQLKRDALALSPNQEPRPILHLIIGNEAGDLDSIVSAIAYTFLRDYQAQKEQQPILILPLINIPQEDFRLRRESVYWLKKLGIEKEDLLFIDMLDLNNLREQGFDIKITLADHNQLSLHQQTLQSMVVEIIDHHDREKEYGKEVDVEIASVGSTSTLIAERILRTDLLHHVSELAQLLIGPIILDTIKLDEKVGRGTERDRLAVNSLLPMIGNMSLDTIWEELDKAKGDLTGLNVEDLLKMDYKGYRIGPYSFGISSIFGLSLQKLVEREENLIGKLESIRSRYGLDVLLVLTGYEVGEEFKRELVIYSLDSVLLTQVTKFLRKDLTDFPESQIEAFTIDRKISRKKLAPLIEDFFNQLSNSQYRLSNVDNSL